MMDNLRAAANHIVLKVILALIIISFVFTGVSGYMFGSSQRSAAEVNGKSVSQESFERAMQEARANRVKELGQQKADQLLADPQEIENLRQSVLRQLIDQELITQYLDSLKLGASGEQVKNYIRAIPAFHSDGSFNNQLYRNYLMSQGISSDQFAAMIRSNVVMEQLNKAYLDTDFILPNESADIAKFEFQERKIRQAIIDIQSLQATQQVTDAEIENFYQQNHQLFASPERIKVEFLKIDAVDIQDKTTVSEQEIEDYYNANKKLFILPTRYEINAIKVKTEDDAKAIIDEIKQGADFAALAKEKSIDAGLRLTGGSLGVIDEDALAKEMVAANLTEKGQISAPIATDGGYLVFQLKDLRKGGERPLADVIERVRRDAQLEKNKLAYYQLQQKVGDAIHNDQYSFKEAETVSGLKAEQTDWFTKDDIPASLNLPELQDMLFNGTLLGQNGAQAVNSSLLQVGGDRAYVLRITDHEPASFKPLADVREQIIDAVKHQKALESAMAKADAIVTDLNGGKAEQEALKESGLSFGEQQLVNRSNTPAAKVFTLVKTAEDKPAYGIAVNRDGNVMIIALDEIIEGKIPEGEALKALNNQLLQIKEISNIESLTLSLRQQAKIQIEV
jgi:peptidyl-prolyl cis-trans isomerase D